MKRLNKVLVSIAVFTLCLLVGQGVHADSYPTEGNKIILPNTLADDKMKIDELTSISLTNENYLLEGLVDRVDFYYEVPVEGLEKGNYLKLNVKYSDLLLSGSTVTVSIDEEMVESFDLVENKTSMELKVPLTGNAVKKGFHHISVYFYGNISKNMCANEENPANWLTILSNSFIHIQTDESLLDRENVLEDFPYPFIQNNQDDVQGTIVIPNNPSENILNAALQLSSYLNNVTTIDEDIKIVKEADLNKISTNIIAVGVVDQWEGMIDDLFTSVDAPIGDGEMVILNRLLQFKEMTKQIMFVTATTDENIIENIPLLTKEAYIEQLTRTDLAVQTLPKVEKEEINEVIPFKDLQIPNVTLSGLQTMSENYFYHVPTYVDKHAEAYVHVKLKVAETLFHDQLGELVVYINHVPHSVAINDLEEVDDGFYKTAIPVNAQLLQQERFVTIQFRGNGLKEREVCVPPTDEQWIFIHEDSYLQVPLVNDSTKETNLQTWPAPFTTTAENNETTILLLDELSEEAIRQLQVLTNSLASSGSMEQLRIVTEDVSSEELTNQNVIIVGNLHEWKDLNKYKEELLVPIDNKGNLLVNEFGFLNETSKYINFIQPSLWNEDKALAVFSAVHTEENTFLSEHLLEYIDKNSTSATIAIQSENGDVFTNKVTEKIEQKRTFGSDTETNQSWIMYTFIGIIAIGIIVLMIVIQRTRKRSREKD